MRFGPSSLRVSRVLAKGLHRPKLRSDLRISKQNVAGETSYVVKIEETSSYRRYGEFEFELLSACDGTRTPAELAAYMTTQHPEQPLDEAEVLEFLDSIEPEVWERTVGEKNLAILERLRDERKGRLDQSSLLYITFKAWDPDKTLAWLDPWLSWMYTREFVIFSGALFLITLAILSHDWTRIAGDTAALWSFTNKSAFDIWLFWILMLVLGGIHEFGHGLTCKHYGGSVHQMGFMLIYLTPAFFTDTTDILLMDRVAPRQWTIFAGIWVEMTVCGLSALIWNFTLPGSIVSDVAYKMMLLSGIQGALLNLNPLIKADGYYALSQHLQVDNLREDAFAYLKAWFLKYILWRNVELPPASRRVRRIFLTFSLAAITYSTTLILVVLMWAKNMCVNKFGLWGYVIFAGLIYFFARKKVRKVLPSAREWLAKKKEELMAWRITRAQSISFAAVALLMALPPVPSSVSSGFILEPAQQADVRATVPGEIQYVFVGEGDVVREGQIIARLEDPELEAGAVVAAQQLALAEAHLRAAEASADPGAISAASREAAKDEQDLQLAKQKAAQLDIRAPIAGIITTPELAEAGGMHFSEGQTFCHISARGEMRARILVRDWEMPDVHSAAEVSLKVTTYPLRTYSGRVERILPAAATDQPVSNPVKLTRNGQALTNYIAVVVDFPNSDGALREGMTGTAKIFSSPRPLAWQWARGAWRWLRSQVW
ncbi:MAG TPA: efflux RND transporter periplasmic adaptor subunit [Candidatus Acidoferrales bacterium]|nr:efflux RND transporter periplasmic adaptor subunit [Candidatus Acidoferrales bacterium]